MNIIFSLLSEHRILHTFIHTIIIGLFPDCRQKFIPPFLSTYNLGVRNVKYCIQPFHKKSSSQSTFFASENLRIYLPKQIKCLQINTNLIHSRKIVCCPPKQLHLNFVGVYLTDYSKPQFTDSELPILLKLSLRVIEKKLHSM